MSASYNFTDIVKSKHCLKLYCIYVYFQLALLRLLLFFNKRQSRAVTDLLTGHNTLRRHLYITEQIDSPMWSRCRAEEEISAHVLCECEAMSSLGRTSLGSFFLDPDDFRSLSLGDNLEL